MPLEKLGLVFLNKYKVPTYPKFFLFFSILTKTKLPLVKSKCICRVNKQFPRTLFTNETVMK